MTGWLERVRDPAAPPLVMGVLNITPDSFSDGGELHRGGRHDLAAVRRRAADMVAGGASLLDIGGESTRPGAAEVPEQQELDRVLPVVQALVADFAGAVVLSVDTSTPAVMAAAAAAGAGLLNDVRALTRPGALTTAAATGLPVCLMHMQGTPATMQVAPAYEDVVAEVVGWLGQRLIAARAAGVPADRLLVDPGIGFGKTLAHNLALLRALPQLARLAPVLVGLSRKRLIGDLTGKGVQDRLAGSVGGALAAAAGGARVLRVHDVAATVDALQVFWPAHGGGTVGDSRPEAATMP